VFAELLIWIVLLNWNVLMVISVTV